LLRPSRFRTLFALLVALSLGLVSATEPGPDCGGSCCSKPPKSLQMDSHAMSPLGCCCGAKAVPCDLEQGNAADPPASAISAAPRVEPPAPGAAAVSLAPVRPIHPAISRRSQGFGPPSQAPPTPLYLRNLCILC